MRGFGNVDDVFRIWLRKAEGDCCASCYMVSTYD